MSFLVRTAKATDYPAFARLFPELAVDDPPIQEAYFVEFLMPTMLIAAAPGGETLGYAYFQIVKDVAYVRHLVSAPEARRTGVGRTLLVAVVELARKAGCTTWCLNVKPENTAAVTLYESFGLTRGHTTKAVRIDWAIVEAGDRMHDARVTARTIEPSEDARVEMEMKLLPGQLALARDSGGRVLVALHETDDDGKNERVVGATIFNPRYPGAYPFRAARPELALVLLRAIHPSARPGDEWIQVVSEGEPEVAAALLAAGATLKMDSVHMKGALPLGT